MSQDRDTTAFYNRAAGEYAEKFADTGRADQDLLAFMDEVPPGGYVLDLGCGPARTSAHMLAAGFRVDATDASQGMADVARETVGIEVRIATFDQLDAMAVYDGVWANFSLLHVPRAEMPANLARIHRALKPGGRLHLGLKTGTGEKVDHLGRFYSFHTEDELRTLLGDAGFTITRTRTGAEAGMAGTVDPFIIIGAHA